MAKEIKTKLKKTRWLGDQIALGILTMNSWKSLWLGGKEKKHWLCLLVSDFTQLIKKSSLFFFIKRSTKLASCFFKKKKYQYLFEDNKADIGNKRRDEDAKR